MAHHIMIDLETLGISPLASIVSVGAVVFDPASDGILDNFYARIDLTSCIELGMVPDQSTLSWWLSQPEKTRQEALCATPRAHIGTALNTLHVWCSRIAPEAVWAYGVTFDIALLNMAYHKLHRDPPWPYGAIKDARTLYHLTEQLSGVKVKQQIDDPHNALSDAVAQALAVQQAYRILPRIGANVTKSATS